MRLAPSRSLRPVTLRNSVAEFVAASGSPEYRRRFEVRPVQLGERASFADLGQTAADYFGVAPLGAGTSFLREILG